MFELHYSVDLSKLNDDDDDDLVACRHLAAAFDSIVRVPRLSSMRARVCVDPCLSKPCTHGGTCVPNEDRTNYTCQCPWPFFGETCQSGTTVIAFFCVFC